MRILVIDDDRDGALAISVLLGTEHQVKTTCSCDEAIKIALDWKPNLLISDWDLKEGGNGVNTCRDILEKLKVAVVFISGSPIEQLKEVAEALNPLHIMRKPIDLDQLTSIVQKLHGELREQDAAIVVS